MDFLFLSIFAHNLAKYFLISSFFQYVIQRRLQESLGMQAKLVCVLLSKLL